jgi:hypothetical protein
MTMGGSTAANAQEIPYCDSNFSVAKIAPGAGSIQFRFEAEYEQVQQSEVQAAATLSESIAQGECFGFSPLVLGGTATIREVPAQGWRLVNVECRTSSTVRRISNGVVLEAPSDEYVSGVCIFYNARVEERQPLNLGGLFSGQPTPLPTAPSAVAPAATSPVISPPRTGDGGLR